MENTTQLLETEMKLSRDMNFVEMGIVPQEAKLVFKSYSESKGEVFDLGVIFKKDGTVEKYIDNTSYPVPASEFVNSRIMRRWSTA